MDNALILGDLHFGERDGSDLVMSHQKKVLDSVIQYCKDNGIKTIIQTGDLFDVRKSTNTKVINFWRKNFFDVLLTNDIDLKTIVGNHDMYYKNTIIPNSTTEIVGHYPNVEIYDKPTEVGDILFVPWICKENQEECINAIKTSEKKICVLHPEIVGANMGGSECTDGLEVQAFDRFETVVCGHFHIRGQYGNCTYVGTPYELTWTDYGDDKGFHILNGTELEFTKLDFPLFHRFTYDEDKKTDYILEHDLTDKHVKLIIENRQDFKAYELFMDKLQIKGMKDLKVIEPLTSLNSSDSVVEFTGELEIKTTESLIEDYISDLYPEKKTGLTQLMLGLHSEARHDQV